MEDSRTKLSIALSEGDPLKVAGLIAAGAHIRYKRSDGYDALLDAVHGRDVVRDPRLLDLLRLLIESGIDLSGISAHQESGLRVLSMVGRFDGIRLLLEAGADKDQLEWTPLIEAVALGSLADVEAVLEGKPPLEETDWWSRTAWMVALLAGSIPKARLLLEHGANPEARGRCGQPPLFYAVAGHHPDVLRWLLDNGGDVDQMDDFGVTAVMEAAESSDLECLEVLLDAGANLEHDANGTALAQARTRGVAKRLLDAGADPQHLSYEGRRAVLGFAPDPDPALLNVSSDEFHHAFSRSFGNTNPERMKEPFWEGMIRSGITGYAARELFHHSSPSGTPVWCAQRFGQSITFLPDGRIVQVGGEHEDHYDADFCIYNDVFVHEPDGSIAIFGYPESAFPPTDFHTATLIADFIYVIGSLGYSGTRLYGETPLYRLDIRTFRMERLDARGEAPGWIYKHRAIQVGPREIRVWLGKVVTRGGNEETHGENVDSFVLDLDRLFWRRETHHRLADLR